MNPSHILQKSLTVLNPLGRVDKHIMDDADLAGPFVFCFAFAFVLLLVRPNLLCLLLLCSSIPYLGPFPFLHHTNTWPRLI